jgi:hypothetical protein
MAYANPSLMAFWLAYGGSLPPSLNPGMPSMKPQYANIICRAILESKDPVHEMHKWYSIACAYGATPTPPPTFTLNQFNNLRRYAAESNCTMSDLFYAVLTELRKGNCPLAGETVASMEKGPSKKPPTSPTINVYTKDNVIHNVPTDKLTEMGPETLASVVAITDEMPWSESRVAAFKKEQGKRLEEAAAKKKAALEAEQALALKVNEDFTSASATVTNRMLIVYYGAPVGRKISLSALLQGSGGTHISDVLELIGDGHSHVPWPDCKVMRLNNYIDTKDVERKKQVRKDQIDELVSKLLKERNEL